MLRSRSGIPSHFFVLPKFNLEDIDPALGSGPHPAFIINGRTEARLFIGQYQGSLLNSPEVPGYYELASLPGIAPALFAISGADSTSQPPAMLYAGNTGPGAHVMTNMEWSAVAMWCQKNGLIPHGNTASGKDVLARHEHGILADVFGRVRTGTGPASWRHNQQETGVCDLVGNNWEWVLGLRLVQGEIQVCQDNDSADWTSGVYGEKPWKAVNFSSGALVTPGGSGTTKLDSTATSGGTPMEDKGAFVFSATRAHNLEGLNQYNFMNISAVSTGSNILKVLGLAPPIAGSVGGVWARNYGTQHAVRGGAYYTGTNASLWALSLSGPGGSSAVRLVRY